MFLQQKNRHSTVTDVRLGEVMGEKTSVVRCSQYFPPSGNPRLSPYRDFSASGGALSRTPIRRALPGLRQRPSDACEKFGWFWALTISELGTPRAICGLAGDSAVPLAGLLPPIPDNFVFSRNRWLVLLAFLGLFLRPTTIPASFHDVHALVHSICPRFLSDDRGHGGRFLGVGISEAHEVC